jgi:hypothetical protein
VRGLATAIALAVLTSACMGSSTHATSPTSTPGAEPTGHPAQPVAGFLAGLLNTEMLGEFPLAYRWLDASQRAHVPEGAFMDWELLHSRRNETLVTARSLGVHRVTRDGLQVLAVRMRITIARGASESSSIRTFDVVDRGDHWTWLLPASVFSTIGNPAT